MADDFHPGSPKSQVAENMIRMDMCIEYVADWPIGHPADSAVQCLAFREAGTCIDNGNTAFSDHETDIGDILSFEYHRRMSRPHVDAGSHLHDMRRFRAGRLSRRRIA